MHKLQAKTVILRDQNGDVSSYFAQTVSVLPKSNFKNDGVGTVVTNSEGATVQVFVKQSTADERIIDTPIVHQFSLAATDLTADKPSLIIELVDTTTTTAVIRKRTVHRDDSDEDQMPL